MIGTGACQNNNYKIVLINGFTMGTTYSIKIKTADAVVNQEKIRADIEKILLEINRKMSTYIVDSELSVINFSYNASFEGNVSYIHYHLYLSG